MSELLPKVEKLILSGEEVNFELARQSFAGLGKTNEDFYWFVSKIKNELENKLDSFRRNPENEDEYQSLWKLKIGLYEYLLNYRIKFLVNKDIKPIIISLEMLSKYMPAGDLLKINDVLVHYRYKSLFLIKEGKNKHKIQFKKINH